MTTIQKHIQEWRDALLTPNQNDVLANITDKNAVDIHSEYQSEKKFLPVFERSTPLSTLISTLALIFLIIGSFTDKLVYRL